MPIDIHVPPLSQTLDTLVIVEWLKQVGDPVVKGETLLTVETDKATLEIESPASGILSSISAGSGEEVKIKSVIGSIAEAGEALPTHKMTGPGGEPLPPERLKRVFASPRARQFARLKGISLANLQGSGTGPGQLIIEQDVQDYIERQEAKPRVTPLARRMAEKAGVDLAQLTPAKLGEAIKKADVVARIDRGSEADLHASIPAAGEAAAQPSAEKGATQMIGLTPIRKTIARRMQESHHDMAAVTYMSQADATRLVKLRKRILKKLPKGSVRPTYTDFLIFITCRTLGRHPGLNVTFEGELLHVHEAIHMALAVDTDRGLIVPVIRDAGSKGVEYIARMRRGLVDSVIDGTVSPDDLSGGTFTLTNLGTLGIDHFTPIINPPQVAILGVGRIRKIPVVHKGKIRVRHVIGLALTCDHRIIDGAPAARFLSDIVNFIENPDLIWI